MERSNHYRRLIVTIVITAVILVAAVFVWAGKAAEDSFEEQAEAIKDTVSRRALQCYVIEGAYPESLDYLVENFPRIMDYNYTADVETNLDRIAEGEEDWRKYLKEIYPPFHTLVESKLNDGQYTHVERVLGTDPADGLQVIAKYGQFGAYVQKGEGETRRFASLEKGQLIETITLQDAISLLALPRTVGSYNGTEIVVTKGKYGPYIKYGNVNITLPRKTDPLTVSLDECINAIEDQVKASPENNVLKELPAYCIVYRKRSSRINTGIKRCFIFCDKRKVCRDAGLA